jgi:large subunit ribosomal protein L3
LTPVLREFRLEDPGEVKEGDQFFVDIFKVGEKVYVTGTSKGKGFAGVVKRHHFRGGAASHGSMFHRAPGSIGASSYPSRVVRGLRMGGHMGQERVTTRNLVVFQAEKEHNLLVLRGAVPGPNGGYVLIHKAKKS